jgi:hypothetical protein
MTNSAGLTPIGLTPASVTPAECQAAGLSPVHLAPLAASPEGLPLPAGSAPAALIPVALAPAAHADQPASPAQGRVRLTFPRGMSVKRSLLVAGLLAFGTGVWGWVPSLFAAGNSPPFGANHVSDCGQSGTVHPYGCGQAKPIPPARPSPPSLPFGNLTASSSGKPLALPVAM